MSYDYQQEFEVFRSSSFRSNGEFKGGGKFKSLGGVDGNVYVQCFFIAVSFSDCEIGLVL